MNRRFYVWMILSITLLLYSGIASTCQYDDNCGVGSGNFCDEENRTGSGIAQCSDLNATGIGTCIDRDLDCTSDSDCNGVGQETCDPTALICNVGERGVGDYCIFDADCGASASCIGFTCTSGVPQTCNTDAVCGAGKYCPAGIDYCVSKRVAGHTCTQDSNCADGLVCSAGVCAECTVDDDTILALEGSFCDTTNIYQCDMTFFWNTYSHANNATYGIVQPKRGNGDYCNKDACCISNNCYNGQCIGGMGGAAPSSTATNYCSAYSDRDLTTNWIDGAVNFDDDPDLSFFNNIFNKTNLTVMILFNKSIGGDNITHHTYYRGIDTATGRMDMMAWFYEPVAEEICYMRQQNTQILWNCIDLTITPLDGSNSTHTYYNASILAEESDAVIATSGLYHLNTAGACGNRWGSMIAYFRLATGTYATADAMTFAFGSNPDPVGCPAYVVMAHRLPQASVYFSGNLYDYVNALVSYPNRDLDRGGQFDKARAGINVYLSTATSFTSYGLQRFPHISSTPASDWATQIISSELESEDYSCCNSNADCADGFCCQNSVCVYCAGGEETVLALTSSAQTIPVNSSVVITATLTFNNNPIPSKPLSFSTTGGTLAPSDCNTNAQGLCELIFTPPSETEGNFTITGEFEGDDEYNPVTTSIRIIVNNDSNTVILRVIEEGTLAAIPPFGVGIRGVRVADFAGGLTTRWTNDAGFVTFSSLPSTPASYVLHLSKEGYESVYVPVELNNMYVFELPRTNRTGYEEEPLPSFELTPDVPEDAEAVTRGLESFVRHMFAYLFPWGIIIIFFLLALSIVYLLLDHATG